MPAKGQRKTHCKYGHELSPDNLYMSKSGYGSCKKCCKNREAAPSKTRKERKLRNRFWSLERYEFFMEAQARRCAICRISFDSLARDPSADHDHETNAPRSLLCNECNSGLGFFKDNSSLLELAAEYLRKYGK